MARAEGKVVELSIGKATQCEQRLKERKWRLAYGCAVVAGTAERCRASESFVMSVLLAHWTNSGHPSSTSMVYMRW